LDILALCNFLINPVINFVLVLAFRLLTNPEISEKIWSIHIRAVRSLAFIVVDRILIVSTTVTNPELLKSILVKSAFNAILTHTHTAIAIIAVPFAWLNFVFLLYDYLPLEVH
jgi:hypothetical protein